MSVASSAAASGAVLGIVVVLLLQQFGYLALNDILYSAVYLVLGAVVVGAIVGVVARALGRRRAPAQLQSSPTPPKTPP